MQLLPRPACSRARVLLPQPLPPRQLPVRALQLQQSAPADTLRCVPLAADAAVSLLILYCRTKRQHEQGGGRRAAGVSRVEVRVVTADGVATQHAQHTPVGLLLGNAWGMRTL